MLFAVVYKMPGVGMLKTNFNNLFFIFFTFFHRWCVVVILLLCMKLASLRLVTFPFYLFWVQFLFGLKLFLHATNVLCFGLRKAILLTYLGFHPSIHPSMLPPYYLFHRIPSQVRNFIQDFYIKQLESLACDTCNGRFQLRLEDVLRFRIKL